MRRAARKDATEAEIVAALRAAGATVYLIGLPVDLLILHAGKTALAECKCITGKRNPKPTRYTELQDRFLRDYKGGPFFTLTDAEGATRAVKMLEADIAA